MCITARATGARRRGSIVTGSVTGMGHAGAMPGDPKTRRRRLLRCLETRRRGASVADLAADLGVSPRTVYRDLKGLAAAGVPLAPEREGTTTVWRMSAVDAGVVAARLAADGPEPLAADATDPPALLATLARALDEARPLDVRYTPAGRNRPLTRRVHPLALRRHLHGLLLLAEDPDGASRTIRVHRIVSAEIGPGPLATVPELDVEAFFREAIMVDPRGPLVTVRLEADPIAARALAERPMHPSQRLTRRPDGSALVELHVADTPELRAWIRAFGPSLLALAPEALARDITAEARAVCRAYAKRGRAPTGDPDTES